MKSIIILAALFLACNSQDDDAASKPEGPTEDRGSVRYERTEGGMKYVFYGDWYVEGLVVVNVTKDSLEVTKLRKELTENR